MPSLSQETRTKISLSLSGSNNPRWSGENVSYRALHKWINRHFGKATKCELCATTTAKKYEWSNKNGVYDRLRENWQQLCKSCHRIYDLEKNIIYKGNSNSTKGEKHENPERDMQSKESSNLDCS